MIQSVHETTYPEAANVYVAILAGESGHLYHSFSDPPYILQAYGPLFYAVNMKIAEISGFEITTVFRLGRLVSFVCYFLGGALVFLIGRTLSFSKIESALAATMLLAQPAFIFWNATFRPDAATSFAMLLSLFFALRDEDSGWLNPAASGLFASVALLLKSSAIAVPVAILVVWLAGKKYKQCVAFVFTAGLPIILTFAVLLLNREPFMGQFTSSGKSIWSIASGARWMFSHRAEAMVWAPALIGVFGCTKALRGDLKSRMIASFFICNLLVGIMTICQVGGDVNYFLPALAGSSLLLPFAIKGLEKTEDTSSLLKVMAIVVLLAAISGQSIELYRQGYRSPIVTERWEELRPYEVLSDWPLFSLYGREPEFLDPQSMRLMELTGHWNPSEFIQRIQTGSYDLILLVDGEVTSYRGISTFGRSEVAAMNSSYEILCTTSPTLVLKPRSRKITATPETLSLVLAKPCRPEPKDTNPKLGLQPGAR